MKRFTVPCDFGGKKAPFNIYVGEPNPKNHPLQNQASWLSSERGGAIPPDVMESFEKLWKIAQENNVSFEDLCVYAMTQANQEKQGGAPAPSGASGGDAATTQSDNPADGTTNAEAA